MEAEKHTPAGGEDPEAHPSTWLTYLRPRVLLYSLSLSNIQPLPFPAVYLRVSGVDDVTTENLKIQSSLNFLCINQVKIN